MSRAERVANGCIVDGFFGNYGGCHVPPELLPIMEEMGREFAKAIADLSFETEFRSLLRDYVGRPSAITECRNITAMYGAGKLFLKREDLNHLGAHKINNALGQALLAKRMGKTRVIAETGAGMHGVATAAASALLGLECQVYMGAVDIEKQAPNVLRMKALGCQVVPVTAGQGTLKEAVDTALEALVQDSDAFYILGSATGPHPYPLMVRYFQSCIGKEARAQMQERTGRLPNAVVACVGGGSNAIGIFSAFLDDPDVRLVGVEPAGKNLEKGNHAATLTKGRPLTFHGTHSYVLCDDAGNADEVYSIASGLDYPGVGPEHAALKDSGRAQYITATDDEAMDAFKLLCRHEGIIPALESSHALAGALKLLKNSAKDDIILVNLSGRGDKDMDTIHKLGIF